MSAERRQLLDAVLGHVPFDGWTDRALAAAARDLGIARGEAKRQFPGGADDLLAYWSAESDRRMLEALAAENIDDMRVRDRITVAVRRRIEINQAHREAVRLALSRALLPHRAGRAMRMVYATVDAMWRAAGDTATDYNFYTKRGLLAGVYSSTLLYWLNDKSEESADSWAFLDRRIADVMKVPKGIGRIKKLVPDPERLIRIFRPRRTARN